MRDGHLVVSVHDVSSATLGEAGTAIERLDRLGARPLVIHVIPSPPSGALAELVRRERRRGSQIVLHGLTHRAAGALRGPALLRLRAQVFAGGAAEMLTVERTDLVERLRRGRALLSEMGADVDAFCAPGWLSPPGIAAAMRTAGLRYQVGMWSVTDVVTARVRWTLPLGYMGVGGIHEDLIALLGGLTLVARPVAPTIAGFLHPHGVATSRAATRTLYQIARLLEERRPATYGDVL